MTSRFACTLLAGVFAIPGLSLAAGPLSAEFAHKDWELACDNTGTCRAAGYHAGMDGPAVSLLLVRSAGAGQQVTARIQIGSATDEDKELAKGVATLAIRVDGRNVGTVGLVPGAQGSPLSSVALDALMPALLHAKSVDWVSGKRTWTLSTAGASAVLLKMDEFQQRIGTVGAIVRKGSKPEDGVLQPVAAPVVIAAPVPKEGKEPVLRPAQRAALLQELRKMASVDACGGLHGAPPDDPEPELEVQRLSGNRLVASVVCELFAYNRSNMFWVINATQPFAPVMVSDTGTFYKNGVISLDQKGRGIGDCWTGEKWTWNGAGFVLTSAFTTGMCKLVAGGGAWELPTYVTTVRQGGVQTP